MATILDIAGKPIPARNKAKSRLRAEDIRDLLKVLLVVVLIVTGYLVFAPERNAAAQAKADTEQRVALK
jgi:hypothetical protein